MVGGYVTFDELVLITGLSENKLRQLLSLGLTKHTLGYVPDKASVSYKDCLYDINEVERWIKVHIF